MEPDTGSSEERRAETARLLSVRPDELDYISDELDKEMAEPATAEDSPPPSSEDVPEIEAAAAQASALVIPNRISYVVWPYRFGFTGTEVVWRMVGLQDPCIRMTTWSVLMESQINRWERAGWCRRPQTDAYDIRWRVYWLA